MSLAGPYRITNRMVPFVLFLSEDDKKSVIAKNGGPPANQTVCIPYPFDAYCKLTHIVT